MNRRIAVLGVVSLVLLACEDSTSNTAPPVSTAPTPTVPTSPTNPTPQPDGGTGADAEAGTEVIPKARTMKLLNLSATPAIKACIRKDGTADPYTLLPFRSEGIPSGAMSARILLSLNSGNAQVIVISATEDCTGTALGTVNFGLAGQAEDVHYGTVLTSTGAQGFVEHLTPTPGKESVMVQPPLSDPRFTPDSTGTPIALRKDTFKADLLDPDLVGKLTLLSATGIERRIKTLAGGTLSLFGTPNTLFLCDDRTTSVNGLTPCPSTLRAP